MFENISYYILDISEKDKINFSEIIHKEFESFSVWKSAGTVVFKSCMFIVFIVL